MRIKVFAKRLWISAVAVSKIRIGLSSLRVFIIGLLYPPLFLLVTTDKNMLACFALVSLPSGLQTIFLDGKRTTSDALFLGIKNGEENCSYPSLKVLKTALIDSLYP